MPQLQIILVSGTHWDREWYRTFQEFRFRLVDILDELLVVLEREEELVFLLDGNTGRNWKNISVRDGFG